MDFGSGFSGRRVCARCGAHDHRTDRAITIRNFATAAMFWARGRVIRAIMMSRELELSVRRSRRPKWRLAPRGAPGSQNWPKIGYVPRATVLFGFGVSVELPSLREHAGHSPQPLSRRFSLTVNIFTPHHVMFTLARKAAVVNAVARSHKPKPYFCLF